MQKLAYDEVPYVPWGEFVAPAALSQDRARSADRSPRRCSGTSRSRAELREGRIAPPRVTPPGVQHVAGDAALQPPAVRRAAQQPAVLHDDLAAQDRHHRIALAGEAFPDAVVGVGVQVARARSSSSTAGRSARGRRRCPAGSRPSADRGRGCARRCRGDVGEPRQRHVALGDELRERHRHARLDAVMAAAHGLDRVAGQLVGLVRRCTRRSPWWRAGRPSARDQRVAVVSELDRRDRCGSRCRRASCSRRR